ncbi:MAG: hypothetical protein K2I52_06615 [Muribaculaceae bacterium]|nr:hypothetical protein [Muribaculaceae bacterium]
MKSEDIFALGLGLLPPWEVRSVLFEDTPDGNKTVIESDGDKPYISSITLDGSAYTPTYFTLDDLRHGALIVINKSETPCTGWGADEKDYPYSFSTAK